jgi:hypothetical protein
MGNVSSARMILRAFGVDRMLALCSGSDLVAFCPEKGLIFADEPVR